MSKQTSKYRITALYARLSNDDDLKGESNSIIHQKQMLEQYAMLHGLGNCQFYVDDGYSGTNFDRPAFQQMLEDIKNNLISTVIVKDLSRFGRNYIDVGFYTDKYFVENNIRFIAISDNIDTAEGLNEYMPFHNLINDLYAKDIAKKQKAVIDSKGNSGKRLTSRVIYGYKKGEDGNWIIDEKTAHVIQKIFQLCLEGYGIKRIANYLTANKIENPSAYTDSYRSASISKKTNNPYLWSPKSISDILSRQEYCGDTVNFKTRRQSLCSKITIKNDPSEYKIFPDTHEAIISREVFEKAQEIRNQRRRISPSKEPVMFPDIYCADCGRRMYIMRSINRKKATPTCYLCTTARQEKNACSSHYVRESTLMECVLFRINTLLELYGNNSQEFQKYINSEFQKQHRQQETEIKENLITAEKRTEEIRQILKLLYEDRVNNQITIEMFGVLSSEYMEEDTRLRKVMIDKTKSDSNFRRKKKALSEFLELIKQYSAQRPLSVLTPDIVRSFIDRIDIFEKQKVNGKKTQKVNIYFKGIGLLNSEILP